MSLDFRSHIGHEARGVQELFSADALLQVSWTTRGLEIDVQ